jgi:hypothetical protein
MPTSLTDSSIVDPPDQDQFDTQLRSALGQVRGALSRIFAAISANVRQPRSISRQFGLDKSLAWKLASVVSETDPYSAVLNMPGKEAIGIFCRVMSGLGVPASALDSLREAVESYQRVVNTHCGDRATLEMIASAASAERSPKQGQQQLNFRRSMFRSASAVFGVQARVHVSSHYLAPNRDDEEMVDIAVVSGLVDFRRIRSDVTWAVSTMRVIERPGSATDLSGREPLDPNYSKYGKAPLMCDFCSDPLPKLSVIESGKDIRKLMLPAGPVGTGKSTTLYTGWITRKVCSRWAETTDDDSEHFVSLSTPVETVIHDFFMHRDLAYARNPAVCLYNQLPCAHAYPNGPRDSGLLPLYEKIQDLSGLPPRPITPDLSDYPRLTDQVFERMGYRAEDFFGVRIQISYPPIPSMLLYRYPLPNRPE